ncbi:MAG: hypothetical protein COB50_00860 [Thiotrichales bacterium]|nr:MAG: hypothetical protein COB50_00860 [Thiotrichales bacterium]
MKMSPWLSERLYLKALRLCKKNNIKLVNSMSCRLFIHDLCKNFNMLQLSCPTLESLGSTIKYMSMKEIPEAKNLIYTDKKHVNTFMYNRMKLFNAVLNINIKDKSIALKNRQFLSTYNVDENLNVLSDFFIKRINKAKHYINASPVVNKSKKETCAAGNITKKINKKHVKWATILRNQNKGSASDGCILNEIS